MRKRNYFFAPSLAVSELSVLACCRVSTAGTGNTGLNRSEEWTEDGDRVGPDHPVVFPEGTVDATALEISPENWQTMPDMSDQCGEFERIEETSSPHDVSTGRTRINRGVLK